MKITPDEVRETALLARLELSEAEVVRMTRELDAILGYMDKLAALDVAGVEPTTHAVPLECPERADEVGPHLTTAEALSGTRHRAEEIYFEVPKIIEVGE